MSDVKVVCKAFSFTESYSSSQFDIVIPEVVILWLMNTSKLHQIVALIAVLRVGVSRVYLLSIFTVKTQFSSIIIIVYTVVACIDRNLGAYI